ncbi:hypothetical protein V3W47_17600 [Deinococcus sp. YIM 134068]|uniref:hypothetical protein n=1 Tax=Deinococcus lichenicola TaxID=3118910 RepID=UPI002F95DFC6
MYRQALLSALITSSEVVAWADRQIPRLDVLPDALVDVSLSGGDTNKLSIALGELGARKLSETAFRLYAMHLLSLLRDDPASLSSVTGALYRLAWTKEAPENIGDKICGFDDELHLARELIYGSLEEVEADVRKFLQSWAIPTAL